MMMNQKNPKFAFFGTGPIAEMVLQELLTAGFTPELVITAPDTPQGRGLVVQPSPVAAYAAQHSLRTLKPPRIDEATLEELRASTWEVFVVADYGSLLRQTVLDIPSKGVLNMHPSLLPRLRGPSPIRSAILTDEKETGVTIMLLDEAMDHGPVLAQRKVSVEAWPPHADDLEKLLAHTGGALLCEVLPLWIAGHIDAHAQNHDIATYTRKFEKSDAEINLLDDAYINLLKIHAFEGWPVAYTYFVRDAKRIRTQILAAHLENDVLILDTVKPEGKQAMKYDDFYRSGARPELG